LVTMRELRHPLHEVLATIRYVVTLLSIVGLAFAIPRIITAIVSIFRSPLPKS
jgi:branched-subunit amino acid permease